MRKDLVAQKNALLKARRQVSDLSVKATSKLQFEALDDAENKINEALELVVYALNLC